MLVLGADIEATGLNNETDHIIELGLVLWDTDRKAPLRIESMLINPGVPIPEEITKLTGITTEDTQIWGIPLADAYSIFAAMAEDSAAVVGHNANLFDKPFLQSVFKRHGLEAQYGPFPTTPWIDTTLDIEYPPEIKTRKLTHLAAEHGFINPFSHRAIFDVLTMLAVMARYDFQKILAFSQEPSILVKAICQPPWEDNGVSTTEAKQNGFYWDGSKKQWSKTIKQNQYQKEAEKAKAYKIAIVS